MNILSATVLVQRGGADLIQLKTDLPPGMPLIDESPLMLTCQVRRGDGVEYVRKNFGINPKVIDMDEHLMDEFARDERS